MWVIDFGLYSVDLCMSPIEDYANLLVPKYLIITFLVLHSIQCSHH